MKKIAKYEIIKKYRILKAEIQRRGLKFIPNVLLDKALFKRAMIGIDVESLGDVVIENYISISGPFVKSSRKAKVVDLVIKDDEENRDGDLEEQISEAVQGETKKKCRFTYDKAGPPPPYIPLFDKIIRAKRETSKVEISKPETTEEYHRIPVRDCKITATIDISEKEGIKALYCGKEKEIATYLFDVDRFTMKEAKAWVKEHSKRIEKGATPHVKLSLMPEDERWNPKDISDSKIIEAILGRDPADGEWTAQMNANAKKVCAWWDGKGGKIDAFKLKIGRRVPITDKSGPLKYNWRQTASRMAILMGARGGVDIPDRQRKPTYNRIAKVYKMFDKPVPEFKKYTGDELKKMFPEEKIEKIDFRFKKVDKKEHIVGGIIYEPDKEDTQGDEASAKEIWKALKNYMIKGKSIKVMHKGKEPGG